MHSSFVSEVVSRDDYKYRCVRSDVCNIHNNATLVFREFPFQSILLRSGNSFPSAMRDSILSTPNMGCSSGYNGALSRHCFAVFI